MVGSGGIDGIGGKDDCDLMDWEEVDTNEWRNGASLGTGAVDAGE
jgi:hypothetical protein